MALLLLSLLLLLPFSHAATFNIINNCPYTIWPAAVPGGGRELSPSQTWTLPIITNSAASGRIWARTKCAFNAAGKGTCMSGDCSGVLHCTANGSPPATVVKYSLNQYGGNDFYDISLVNGYNVPVEITPTGAGNCMAVRCANQNIVRQCPSALRAAGGCRSACDVYKSNEYCCYKAGSCWATSYSKFFKNLCPNSYTYPQDDPTSTFTCNSGASDDRDPLRHSSRFSGRPTRASFRGTKKALAHHRNSFGGVKIACVSPLRRLQRMCRALMPCFLPLEIHRPSTISFSSPGAASIEDPRSFYFLAVCLRLRRLPRSCSQLFAASARFSLLCFGGWLQLLRPLRRNPFQFLPAAAPTHLRALPPSFRSLLLLCSVVSTVWHVPNVFTCN